MPLVPRPALRQCAAQSEAAFLFDGKIVGMRWLVVIALIFGSRVATADDKPWAVGVSKADQDAALALYKEGNEFFAQDKFKDALEKYCSGARAVGSPRDPLQRRGLP